MYFEQKLREKEYKQKNFGCKWELTAIFENVSIKSKCKWYKDRQTFLKSWKKNKLLKVN